MSANAGRDNLTLEELRAKVEREKLELTSTFIGATADFTRFDGEFNRRVLETFDVVLAAAKSAPAGGAFRSERSGIDEIIIELLKKRAEGGPGVAGGDVVGGDWIDDLERIVKALSGVVKEEKDFFLQIIKLIFCGC